MTDKYHILFGWLIDRLSQLYTTVYMAKEDVVIVPEDVSHVCVHLHACIDEIVPSWPVNFSLLVLRISVQNENTSKAVKSVKRAAAAAGASDTVAAKRGQSKCRMLVYRIMLCRLCSSNAVDLLILCHIVNCHNTEIFTFSEYHYPEICVRGHSRSLEMTAFDRLYVTSIVTVALSCTVFDIVDFENRATLNSRPTII